MAEGEASRTAAARGKTRSGVREATGCVSRTVWPTVSNAADAKKRD